MRKLTDKDRIREAKKASDMLARGQDGDEWVASDLRRRGYKIRSGTVADWRYRWLRQHGGHNGATASAVLVEDVNAEVADPFAPAPALDVPDMAKPTLPPNSTLGPKTLTGQTTKSAKNLTEYGEKMTEALKSLFEDGGFQRLLFAKRLNRGYSIRNMVMIYTQYRNADEEPTLIMPRSKWEKLGRTVKPDRRGAIVMCPQQVKIRDENGEIVKDEDGKAKTRTRFIETDKTRVFDVQDTEGPDIPGVTSPLPKTKGSKASAQDMHAALTKVAERAGLTVERKAISPDISGYLKRSSSEIVLNETLDDVTSAQTLAHELGHFFDPELQKRPHSYSEQRSDCEVIAEMTAMALCDEWGLDSLESSSIYVGSYHPGSVRIANKIMGRFEDAYNGVFNTLHECGLKSPSEEAEEKAIAEAAERAGQAQREDDAEMVLSSPTLAG